MNKLGFISLFTGAGGLDLGLKTSGFKPLLSVENDRSCRATLKINDKNLRLSSEGNIFNLSSSEILDEARIKVGALPLLVGGPPCQPFSKSSYWSNSNKSRMDDPRARCLIEYMRVAGDILPEVTLIENVTGIGYSDKNDGLEYIKSRFREINELNGTHYQPNIFILNSAHYGVPQLRKRLFVIASRRGLTIDMPDQYFYDPESTEVERDGMEPYRTAWDAIGDLDSDISCPSLNARGKWADLLPSIPEGKNYLWHTKKSGGLSLFGWRTRYWSFLLKLQTDKPSWTITASPGPATGPFHWRNRNLSTRELARLQTYPDSYRFSGSVREIRKQIGNSVPPALGELLGLEIRRQFFNSRVRKKLRLVPEKNSDKPTTIQISEVPNKYLSLIDEYADHPGTGRGPGVSTA